MYHSMRNKKPVRKGSQAVAKRAGPRAALHLLLISEQTKNLLGNGSVLGGCTFSARLVAPLRVPSPGFTCGLHRPSACPLNVREEEN